MLNLDELKEMLELNEERLKKLDDEQLKVLLGCVNYASRTVTREVNRREETVINN